MTTRRDLLRCLLAFGSLAVLPSCAAGYDKRATAVARVKIAHDAALATDSSRGTKYLSTFRRLLAGDISADNVRATNDATDQFEAAWNDPAFIREFNSVIDRAIQDGAVSIAVVGGAPDMDHPDCVAVKTSKGWKASGVLVSDRVVLTASHVYRDSADKIWVGRRVDNDGAPYSLNKSKAKPEPTGSDLAIVVLADTERVPEPQVKRRGDATATNRAKKIHAVGYGSTRSDGTGYAGERRYALLVNGPNPCTSSHASQDCKPRIEFISGGANKDTCNGDSGGGAYWEDTLLGITSRRVKVQGATCGLGGVFVRVAEHNSWIQEMIDSNR